VIGLNGDKDAEAMAELEHGGNAHESANRGDD